MPKNTETQTSLAEFMRPWKLFSLALGIVMLIAGSLLSALPDWNIAVSVLMALATYFSASWVLRVFITRQWSLMPAALLTAWGTIYGCYIGYWQFTDPQVVAMLPGLAIVEVACLYVMCGFLWLFQGSVKDFLNQMNAVVR